MSSFSHNHENRLVAQTEARQSSEADLPPFTTAAILSTLHQSVNTLSIAEPELERFVGLKAQIVSMFNAGGEIDQQVRQRNEYIQQLEGLQQELQVKIGYEQKQHDRLYEIMKCCQRDSYELMQKALLCDEQISSDVKADSDAIQTARNAYVLAVASCEQSQARLDQHTTTYDNYQAQIDKYRQDDHDRAVGLAKTQAIVSYIGQLGRRLTELDEDLGQYATPIAPPVIVSQSVPVMQYREMVDVATATQVAVEDLFRGPSSLSIDFLSSIMPPPPPPEYSNVKVKE